MSCEKDAVEKNYHRIASKQPCQSLVLMNIYSLLKVKALGEPVDILVGRVATNIIQETDRGKLIIRIYPKNLSSKLETGHPLFEIEALNFYSSHGINVPVPVRFGEKFYFETGTQTVFAYFYLRGTPIKQSELSVRLAKSMGEFLYDMLKVSVLYSLERPCGYVFINSFDHILQMAGKIECKYTELKEFDTWITMKNHAKMYRELLDTTPKGIVHADYFFENILKDGHDEVIGLVDFGDAYPGHVLHDLVIGAMEACVLPNEIWNFDILGSFLQATSDFLKLNSITFEQFFETLKINCFRFSIYTISATVNEGKTPNGNTYIKRYEKLSNEEFKQNVYEVFMSCVM